MKDSIGIMLTNSHSFSCKGISMSEDEAKGLKDIRMRVQRLDQTVLESENAVQPIAGWGRGGPRPCITLRFFLYEFFWSTISATQL